MISKFIKKAFELDSLNNSPLEVFMKRMKKPGLFSNTLIFSQGNSVTDSNGYIDQIFPKMNLGDMRLTDEAKVFLNNSEKGNSFVAIGDLKTKKLYVHPVTVNNNRRVPASAPSELTYYRGVFPANCKGYNKYISHNNLNAQDDLDDYLKEKILICPGTAHQQLLFLIKGDIKHALSEKHNFQSRYFGFAIFNNGKKGSQILGTDGLPRLSVRIRSNFINNWIKRLNVLRIDDKEYIKFSDNMNYSDIERSKILDMHMHSEIEPANMPTLPMLEAANLSKALLNGINNIDLINSFNDSFEYFNSRK